MKIKRMVLENFQSHQSSALEFHPNFNCIVGPTNVGKTAIFNALLFAFHNEWDGDFLRHGATKCTVRVECDTLTLIRTKGKAVNSLAIIDETGREMVYDNFGTEYPPDILPRLTGFIEAIPVCVAYQDSNSFLIHETPANRGKLLDNLSGIDVIEGAITRIRLEQKNLQQHRDRTEYDRKACGDELSALQDLGDLDSILRTYKELTGKHAAIKQRSERVHAIGKQLAQLDAYIGTARRRMVPHKAIQEALQGLAQQEKARGLVRDVHTKNMELASAKSRLAMVRQESDKCLHELLEVLKTIKLCPFCGSALTPSAVDHIFGELM